MDWGADSELAEECPWLGALTGPLPLGCAPAARDQVPRETAVIVAMHVRLRVVMIAGWIRRLYVITQFRRRNRPRLEEACAVVIDCGKNKDDGCGESLHVGA